MLYDYLNLSRCKINRMGKIYAFLLDVLTTFIILGIIKSRLFCLMINLYFVQNISITSILKLPLNTIVCIAPTYQ